MQIQKKMIHIIFFTAVKSPTLSIELRNLVFEDKKLLITSFNHRNLFRLSLIRNEVIFIY